MKVVCINKWSKNLKYHQIYDTEYVSRTGSFYHIKNNIGLITTYPSHWFISLEEHRNQQINKIIA